MLDLLGDLKRTHTCGQLRAADAGQRVTVMGWINRRRDLGSLIFIDVRDRTGLVQAVFDPNKGSSAAYEKASALRNEFVVAVTGTVKVREAKNPKLPSGDIEVVAEELRILNESKPLPFVPGDENAVNTTSEETRLKYRYLDLRRPPLQANIELRHRVAQGIRKYLDEQGFYEIETPFMTRSTPEGARDYLVPSRIYPGSFYALPQSPQLFKQILMISGFDKYFQIVRCFRDEDLRADRQPEFTQIDLEMTFPQQETVFAVVEGFVGAAWKVAGHVLKTPFPRMTYDEALRNYGSDKPDMRLPALTEVGAAFRKEDLDVLTLEKSLPVVAVRIPQVGELSRREREEIRPLMKAGELKLIDDFKRLEKGFPEAAAKVKQACAAGEGDLVVLVAGARHEQPAEDESGGRQHDHTKDQPDRRMSAAERHLYDAAGALRLELARKYADRHKLFERTGDAAKAFRFAWVTDFPMFEFSEEEGRWQAAHHPFTSPHERDMEKVLAGSELGSVRALAYDIVLNGTELGSGSIRIHRQDVQRQIFSAMGIGEEEARSRFGFFLEALEYGTPPHGGIALGLDRIVMILAGAQSLREVIPFPKTAKAVDLMVDAPTPVEEKQLKELGIGVRPHR